MQQEENERNTSEGRLNFGCKDEGYSLRTHSRYTFRHLPKETSGISGFVPPDCWAYSVRTGNFLGIQRHFFLSPGVEMRGHIQQISQIVNLLVL